MKNVFLILTIIVLFSCNVFAQKYVSLAVEKEFATYGKPQTITNFISQDNSYSNPVVGNISERGNYYDLNSSLAEQIIAKNAPVLSIQLTMENKIVILDMVNAESTFSEAKIVTSDGRDLDIKKMKQVFYRGIIRGQESNSLVAISINQKEVAGFISTDKGNFIIGKLEKASKHIIYPDINLIGKLNFECGTEDTSSLPNGILDKSVTAEAVDATVLSKCVKLSYETEYDLVQRLGDDSQVLIYVTLIHNQVATLYYNEGILTPVGSITIWTAEDPYTGNTTDSLLTQYKNNTSSITGDLSQLLTFRSIGGGQAAGFAGLCNSNVDEKLSVSMIYTTYNTVPTYSWTISVITHEFGHLFGSRHTHACVWNGNNTAIDSCAGGTEGGCASPGIPSGGGTIMSYCHLTSAGINFSNGFGIQPGNKIRQSVTTANCLLVCRCLDYLTVSEPITTSQTIRVSEILTSTSTIASNLNVTLSGEQVVLMPGFYVSNVNGGYFLASVNPCNLGRNYQRNEQLYDAVELNEADSLDKQFKLMPNPATTKFTVESTLYMKHITVTSFDGKVMFNRDVNDKTTSYTIDIDGYTQGIYTVTVLTQTGETQTKKLIIN